jgi:hypothetical protein
VNRPLASLTLEEMGIHLEEDSEDFTELEALMAVETETSNDFVDQLIPIVTGIQGAKPVYELRRRAGILYCRVLVEPGVKYLFKLPWLRRTP